MPPSGQTPLNSGFKLIFVSICIFTALSLGVSVGCAMSDSPNPRVEELFRVCTDTWKYGVGALIGLLTGKKV